MAIRALSFNEIKDVSGSDAGVPHSNYYYGPYWYTDWWSNAVDSMLDAMDGY